MKVEDDHHHAGDREEEDANAREADRRPLVHPYGADD
eukprot:CAMPEP_0176157954 /NCGR_PEP_ID=MMETSP0120_2-20121206/80770_1 /TAXON_ID=160619 /ORGANISM="Kryptoperidinium foliaceum, Strain CCMP 1326" /LENGTH=36 /DNA_ID= /DNA_START= /DNA_END= /DNA_ORIENTATION=